MLQESKDFRKVVLEAEELAPYRHALEAKNLAVELSSGAKVLVHAEHYEAAVADAATTADL